MNSNQAGIVLLVFALFFCTSEPVQEENSAYWIKELGSSSFDRREEAFFRLQRLGAHARESIRTILPQADLQTRVYLRYLLEHEPVHQAMAPVPKGTYTLGSPDGSFDNPERKVELHAFLIDVYEVTHFMYYVFVRSTGHPSPPGWQGNRYPLGSENLPVTNVAYQDAAAYALWAGKRLPTAEEWEAAARGAGRFPWGDRVDKEAANLEGRSPEPVGRFEKDRSPRGCFDMAGNVSEWVLAAGEGENGREGIPARKGAAFTISFLLPSAALYYRAVPVKPEARSHDMGFRCVRASLPPEEEG